jgi:hypothetical protein
MIQGRQVGTLMLDGYTGVQVTIDEYTIYAKRISNGVTHDYKVLAMYKDKYDSRQGAYVGGVILCDAKGYPLEEEHYTLSDFTWSGNISYGGGTIIPFL